MKNKFLFLSINLLIWITIPIAYAQSSDNLNGTFTNPVLWADFPDPDVLVVGDNYYMVSTSMHSSLGVKIMKQKDPVNWEYLSFVIDRFKFDPAYDMEGGKNRYAKGQWATSINYKDGKYYILFTTLDEGSYMCIANDPAGP